MTLEGIKEATFTDPMPQDIASFIQYEEWHTRAPTDVDSVILTKYTNVSDELNKGLSLT